MRAVDEVAVPPGTNARGYTVEWKTVNGVEPCGGNAYSAYCTVLLGENGDPNDVQSPKLARPRSVTIEVRAEFR